MEVPIRREGRPWGTLQVTEQAERVHFLARVPQGGGLCRLYACGADRRLLLGVLEEGERELRRCFSRRLAGEILPILCGKAENFTQTAREGWRKFAPRDLPRFPLPAGDALCRNLRDPAGGLLLALPFEREGAFPLTELFCFAELRRMWGRDWVVYRLTGDGEPLPPKEYEDAAGKNY